MFGCFVCSKLFNNSNDLCDHNKLRHSTNEYVCCQLNCHRKFSSIRSFKKHLKTHTNDEVVQNVESFCNIQSCFEEKVCITDHDEEMLTNEDSATLSNTLDNEIFEAANSFVFALYAKNSLDRQTAENVTKDVADLLSKILANLKQNIVGLVKNTNHSYVNDLFCNASTIFKKLDTQKKVIKKLTTLNCYKPSKKIVVQDSVADTLKSRTLSLGPKITELSLIDVSFKFKSFFELPGMYDLCMNYAESLKNDPNISNFVQCDTWKEIMKSFEGKTVIPYFLYHDDFETGNPLGACKGKHAIGGFYINFPTLPPSLASKLENIIAVMFMNKSIKHLHCMGHVLYSLIDVLINLEENGVEIELPSGKIRVYFVLGLILGDNLGLNEILGIRKAFSRGYFCRICSCTNEETKRITKENIQRIRTVTSYDRDALKKDPTSTGINEICPFNRIRSFHIIKSPSVDILHDFAEGINYFELTEIIKSLISKKKFSLDDLNNRKSLFDYGPYEIKNMPSADITMKHLENNKFAMTASQSITFARCFGLMMGDMVPKGDGDWSLYMSLVKMLHIVMENSLTKNQIDSLEKLIPQNLNKYKKLYKKKIKPKMHIITHYPRLFRKVGPLKKIWTMRNEGRHRTCKRYSNVTSNRKNLPFSLAIKDNLNFAYRLYKRDELLSSFTKIKTGKIKVTESKFYKNMNGLFESTELENVVMIERISYNSVDFFIGVAFFHHINEELQALEIVHIIKSKNEFKIFAGSICLEKKNEHFDCYFVKKKFEKFYVIDFKDLKYFPQHLHKVPSGKLALRPPCSL